MQGLQDSHSATHHLAQNGNQLWIVFSPWFKVVVWIKYEIRYLHFLLSDTQVLPVSKWALWGWKRSERQNSRKERRGRKRRRSREHDDSSSELSYKNNHREQFCIMINRRLHWRTLLLIDHYPYQVSKLQTTEHTETRLKYVGDILVKLDFAVQTKPGAKINKFSHAKVDSSIYFCVQIYSSISSP